MNPQRRIGILGGNFDPIHCGHLDVALAAARTLQLDHVRLMPASVAPHRAARPHASAYHRFAMAALAALDHPGILVTDLELRHSGPSYTSRTLQRLAAGGYDPVQLFFITGADAFAEIATWYDYPGLLERGHFVVVSRPGASAGALRNQLPDLASRMHETNGDAGMRSARTGPAAIWLIDAATQDVSSTDVRARLAADQSIAGLVPASVETHIRRHGLYAPGGAADELHE